MKVLGVIDEDFTNYKTCAMFINTIKCNGKCYRELGLKETICQNSELHKLPILDINDSKLIERYLANDLSKAIVFGGLEPFDQIDELVDFTRRLRRGYKCDDPIIIYTGYTSDEIVDKCIKLKQFENIIVKIGRYIPNKEPHMDMLLGVKLASPNQFAFKLC